MISDTLGKLGFQEKEINVYLEVLRRGKTTPAAVAKATGINRATVYSVSKSLLERGVMTEDLAGKSLYLVAKPAEDLTSMIERASKELDRKKRLVHDAIDELAQLPTSTQYSVPQIRFIEEENIDEHMTKQIPAWNASILKVDPDKRWWGFQDHTFVEHYKQWILDYWKVAPEEIDLRLLSNESKIEEEMKKEELDRRQIRFWDKSKDFSATTWAIGEYIIMIYTRERPFYLIEIFNPVFAENQRQIFKNLWSEVVGE